jgi:hypothetical protein
MHWIREGADWVLEFNRRKLGRVFPDDRYPGMWRLRPAVLAVAERAFSPPKPQALFFRPNRD